MLFKTCLKIGDEFERAFDISSKKHGVLILNLKLKNMISNIQIKLRRLYLVFLINL